MSSSTPRVDHPSNSYWTAPTSTREVGDIRLNELRIEQWRDTLESLDSDGQSLWKMTKRVMRVPTSSPPLQVPEGLALSDSENVEALADSLEAQFQPVSDPSDPTVTETVSEAMRAYEYSSASEPKLTSPS
jgi:hypothetical protein